MRYILNVVIALSVMAGLGGVAWLHHADGQEKFGRDNVRAELHRFRQQVAFQATLLRERGIEQNFPETVDPMWFSGNLPRNILMTDAHPWLEIANEAHRDFIHPLMRVATHESLAKFWYNPFNGVLRARVPAALSDQQALETYNYINDCSLDELFETGNAP